MNYKEIYNKEYFDGKKSFFYKLGYGNFAKFYFDTIFKPLKPYIKKLGAGKVLDVGCAFGFILQRFPDSFEKFGVDVSEYAIGVARQKLPDAKFIVANAEDELPFPEETFDIITCNDVLEHLEHPEKALKNIFKALKREGILYINTPNLNSFRKKVFGYADKKEHHIGLFLHKDMMKLLEKTGFKIVKNWTYINPTYFFFIKFISNIGTESAFICAK
ncbi:MAG: class I SAM-dependent methyltransferase [Candidatus Moranbacteria bacterium]|nr:class I SAM-dependent methyltransferase [Candidatus Moranbacteria bacterium]